MTINQIKKALSAANSKLSKALDAVKLAELELQFIIAQCPHTDKETWTNDDGHGQFKVERCRICGEQRDGGFN